MTAWEKMTRHETEVAFVGLLPTRLIDETVGAGRTVSGTAVAVLPW